MPSLWNLHQKNQSTKYSHDLHQHAFCCIRQRVELWLLERGKIFDKLGPRLSVIIAVAKATCSNRYWELTLCLALRTLYTTTQKIYIIPFYRWENWLSSTGNLPKITENKDSIACILTPKLRCINAALHTEMGDSTAQWGLDRMQMKWCKLGVKQQEWWCLWRRDNLCVFLRKVLF